MKNFLKPNYSVLYDTIQEIYSLSSVYFGKGNSLLPLRYTLELTYRCNLSCSYCYVGKTKNISELSTEDWFKIIDQIPPLRLITLVGGETLIRKDFKAILEKCLAKGKVNIVTNATLFNDELIKTFVDRKLLLLNISIDGIGEKHDLARGHKGTFDKVITNLEKLNKAKGNKKYPLLGSSPLTAFLTGKAGHPASARYPLIDIKSMVLENNLDDLVEIYKLADHYKADFFTLSFLKESDLQQNACLREDFGEEFYKTEYPIHPYFDIEHFEDIYRQIQELSKKSKTAVRFYPKFNPDNELNSIKNFYSKALNLPIQNIYHPCHYPWANILITPEGNIYPCLSYKIGNVKDTPIKDIWNNDKFKKFRKQLDKNKVFNACQACCQLRVKY